MVAAGRAKRRRIIATDTSSSLTAGRSGVRWSGATRHPTRPCVAKFRQGEQHPRSLHRLVRLPGSPHLHCAWQRAARPLACQDAPAHPVDAGPCAKLWPPSRPLPPDGAGWVRRRQGCRRQRWRRKQCMCMHACTLSTACRRPLCRHEAGVCCSSAVAVRFHRRRNSC